METSIFEGTAHSRNESACTNLAPIDKQHEKSDGSAGEGDGRGSRRLVLASFYFFAKYGTTTSPLKSEIPNYETPLMSLKCVRNLAAALL